MYALIGHMSSIPILRGKRQNKNTYKNKNFERNH